MQPHVAATVLMLTGSSGAAALRAVQLALALAALLLWELHLEARPAGPKSGALGGSSPTWPLQHSYLGHLFSNVSKSRGEGSGVSTP